MDYSSSIVLKPILEQHTNLIVSWRNKEFVKNQLFSNRNITVEEHINWLHDFVEKGLVHQFIIYVNEIPIGTCFIKNIDEVHKKGEFGIFIGESEYLGKGIGSLATKLIIDYAFKNLLLNKIYLKVYSDNINAIKAYSNAGFKIDGIFREEYFINGFKDIHLMSILKREWAEKNNE